MGEDKLEVELDAEIEVEQRWKLEEIGGIN